MFARLMFAFACALFIAGCSEGFFPPDPPRDPDDLQFVSADPSGRGRGGEFGEAPTGAPSDDEAEGGAGDEAPREVVEPDVIRRVGNLLFVLNQYRGLTIVDLDTRAVLSQTATPGFPRDLYLVGDRAYVLVGYAQNYLAEGDVISFDVGSRLHVLDIADPAAPQRLGEYLLEGDLIDSRLVGDVLYSVSAEFIWYVGEPGVGVAEPGGGGGSVGSPRVAKQQTSGTFVSSINVANPAAIGVVDSVRFDGYGTVIQATNSAMFVAAPKWETDTTTITYVDIDDPAGDIVVRGAATVPGTVADRFKMDAFEGVLRVVSNTWFTGRQVYVTTVDLANPDALAVLGQTTIEGATGETLFATRFDGPRAYVVTYLVIDPLFVLDLSDPANPRVTGELHVPGWSTHIEPLGDRLIALGVDDTNGRRVSVSIFDVADPAAPALADKVSFGEGWAWSTAYGDVKALTVLDDLILVPFGGWSEADGSGFERLQLVSYSGNDLTAEGYVDVQGQVVRSFEHGGGLFALTQEELAALDATNRQAPVVTGATTLAEYVADAQPLANGFTAEVVSVFGRGETKVKVVDGAGNVAGSTTIPVENVVESGMYGNVVVVVASNYDTTGYYTVASVDCANPAAPVLVAQQRVDVQPWYGGYYGYPFYPGPLEDAPVPVDFKDEAVSPWYWWGGSSRTPTAFVAGDRLVLRCYVGEALPPDYRLEEGLAVLALPGLGVEGVAEIDYDQVAAVQPLGDQLLLGVQDSAGLDDDDRPLAAWFVRRFDPASRALGPEANVPGALVQYDAGTQVLVLDDVQYDEATGIRRELRTVKWDGDEVTEDGDTLALSDRVGTMYGRGRVYYEKWDTGYALGSFTVDGEGNLSEGSATASSSEYWGWFLDGRGDNAYVVLGGRAIARYDFSANPATLVSVDEGMDAPLRLRFTGTEALAPMGFAGLARLPY